MRLPRDVRLAALIAAGAAEAGRGRARRWAGADAQTVNAQVRARNADRTRAVLGGLKGGPLKAGQLLSTLTTVLPADPADSWQEALTSLQEHNPGVGWPAVQRVLAAELGARWPTLVELDPEPVAAASLGQVHRGVWRTAGGGRPVAVKVQYPGIDRQLRGDLRLLSALTRAGSVLAPRAGLPAVARELRRALAEEVDYTLEAARQEAFHRAYQEPAAAADAVVPQVVTATRRVLVQQWLDGEPLVRVASEQDAAVRDRAGLVYQRFLVSGPARCGLLHTDPHPGNFRLTGDGRLVALDYGSCLRLPEGLPPSFGHLIAALADGGDDEQVRRALVDQGLLRPGSDLDVGRLRSYLAPFSEPARHEWFSYSGAWLRGQLGGVQDPRRPDLSAALALTIPAEQLFTHRVWLGLVGVLCRLEATVPVRPELRRWLPGFPSD